MSVTTKTFKQAMGLLVVCALLILPSLVSYNSVQAEPGEAVISDANGLGTQAISLGYYISAGGSHTCVILDNNTVKCWGRNSSGQLGYGDLIIRGDNINEMGDNLPTVDLGTGRTAKMISAGSAHTCVILDNNTVKCWGRNTEGQLGYGDVTWRGDGAGEMGDSLLAVNLGTGRTAKRVSAGTNFTCALLDNDTVKCWGSNTFGQLGLGDVAARGDGAGEMGDSLPVVDLGTGRTAKIISTGGQNHTCALLDNDTVKCWGNGALGRLGYEDTTSRGDGANEMGDNLLAVNLGTGRTARTISTGALVSCAILDNNTSKCWGSNSQGKLGLGDTNNRGDNTSEMGDNLPAIDLGTGRTAKVLSAGGAGQICAILDNDTVKCWGANNLGYLGYNDVNDRGDGANEMGDNLAVVDLGSGRTAKTLSAGNGNGEGGQTCVILDNSTIKCWGGNSDGLLGYGDITDRGKSLNAMGDNLAEVSLGSSRTVPAISSNMASQATATCVILDNSAVKCWGSNSNGQLGYGDTNNRGDATSEMGDNLPAVDLGTGRTASIVVAGSAHSCAILDNATVKCWGNGAQGRLGYGDTTTRGDGANEMGDNLPVVDLGTGRTATAIALGSGFTCAILDNATVKCWGANTVGSLGLGDTDNRGDASGEMGDSLPAVNLGSGRTATSITAGNGQVCALLDNASVKCWGSNGSGELGLGDTATRGDGANEMGDNLSAVSLGTGRTAQKISAGDNIVCALLDNNTVKCWGAGTSGRLGQGDTSNRGDGSNEMGDNLPAVNLGSGRTATAVVAGTGFVCGVLDNTTLKCWGISSNGQLGQGSADSIGDDANEMGDNLLAINFGAGRTVSAVVAAGAHACALLNGGKIKCWGAGSVGRLGYENTIVIGSSKESMGNLLLAVDVGAGRIVNVTTEPARVGTVSGTAGNTTATLTWSAPNTGGSAITDYLVEYTTNSGTSWTTFTDGVSASTGATVTGLTNGTVHQFRVSAQNALGFGAVSATSSNVTPGVTTTTTAAPTTTTPATTTTTTIPATTTMPPVTTTTIAPAVPDAPTSITITIKNNKVFLKWSAPENTGGAPIIVYLVEFTTNNGRSWTTFANSLTSVPRVTLADLKGGKTYQFRVRAVNMVGEGVVSAVSPRVTLELPVSTPSSTTTTVVENSTTTTTAVPRNITITNITVIETLTTNITRTCVLEKGGQKCTTKTEMHRLINYGFSSHSFIDSRR
jgi:alpha-tubulin suppressor-like RCC1 family protein